MDLIILPNLNRPRRLPIDRFLAIVRASGGAMKTQVGAVTDRKAEAADFLRLASSGQVRAAAAKCTPEFVHHNPYFAGDGESLFKAMEENAKRFPKKSLEIQRAVAEGDLVAVHSKVQLEAGGPVMALVHIF